MNLKEKYTKETGKQAIGYEDNNSYYSPDYIKWLEKKMETLEKEKQSLVQANIELSILLQNEGTL